MSIQHIEDLPPDEFIQAVQTVHTCDITEKLDGANLIIGCDNDGQAYTSREGKSGERFYHLHDYGPVTPATVGFMQAHTFFLYLFENDILPIPPGAAISCEVLFERQPNAIVYGDNHLVLLHGVTGDGDELSSDEFDALSAITAEHIISGVELRADVSGNITQSNNRRIWNLSSIPHVDGELFKLPAGTCNLYVTWLRTRADGCRFTNQELLQVNLNQIPKSERAEVKYLRESARSGDRELRADIKKGLVNTLEQLVPRFRTDEVTSSEDTGVEGVVCFFPDASEPVKIVNREGFTAINAFNHMIRNQIRKTSHGKIPQHMEFTIPIFGNGDGIYDSFLSSISEMHSMQLTNYMRLKPELRTIVGDTLSVTVNTLEGKFLNRSVIQVRGEVDSKLVDAINNLQNIRNIYCRSVSGYSINLGQREIGYTKAIHQRTLLMFAEVEGEFNKMRSQVQFADSMYDIIMAVYGKPLNSIH